jgi:hypothetical protein
VSALPIPASVEAPARRPAGAPGRTTARARAAARRPTSARPGILNGVLWIVLMAVLLAGVVALNVAVLQLNVRLDRLAQERAALKASNAASAKQLATAGSPLALERLAQRRLRLVPATPEQTEFLRLHR